MTITLAWWIWPVAIFCFGLVAFVLCQVWAMRQSGLLGGFFEGLLGIVALIVCAGISGGILLGRWLA